MAIEDLFRREILSLRTLATGKQDDDSFRLNANEAPYSSGNAHGRASLNRYPDVRPHSLQSKMAALYGVPTTNLMVTRGSSEAIDVLIRSACRAGEDSIVTMSPTFGLYRYLAQIQGATNISVAQNAHRDYAFDADEVLLACTDNTKLVVVCTPNNPTGAVVSQEDVVRIAANRRDKSIVVVDEAYIEFSGRQSMAADVDQHDNLVVLRTLSKAFALAGARCGAAISNETLAGVLSLVLPPFSFATPSIGAALEALSATQMSISADRIATTVCERERVHSELTNLNCVEKVWPSGGNFLLFRIVNQPAVLNHLQAQKVLILGYRAEEHGLENCARVTIGSQMENDAFLNALREYEDMTKR